MKSKKTLGRLLRPSMRLYLVFLIIFAAAPLGFGFYALAGAELSIAAIIVVYSVISEKRRRHDVLTYVKSITNNMDEVTKDTFLKMPLPMVIFSLHDGHVLWSNDKFHTLTGNHEMFFELTINDLIPSFESHWLLEGKGEAPEYITISERTYKVYGNALKTDMGELAYWGVLYWVDLTDYLRFQSMYNESRPVIAIIVMDNYDEVFKNLNDTSKSSLLAAIDQRMSEWTKDSGGYLTRSDRDKYIFIFEEKYLQGFIDAKFSVLDSIREIQSHAGVAATLSIGIGKDAGSYEEGYAFANLGVEMALSRGGDQVVIKNRLNFEFYGGHVVEVERRTKVKARVMANGMGELITDASNLIIMGHKHSDYDCIGAAAGVCCIARKKGKQAFVALNMKTSAAVPLIKKLSALSEYENVFISEQDAMLMADSKTLLVIVDTNRPEQVEFEPLLQSINRVAVIDHHRRASTYITNAALNFHEPYASSASELVTELLQYLGEPSDILKAEAEAIMAGIVLDSKNFTMRTGSRTFEAAAFLRRVGCDTTEVKKLFQTDLSETVKKYHIIQNAKLYKDRFAIAVAEGKEDRITAAKAADELVTLREVNASFVVYRDSGFVNISARSAGEINVQLVLERLGGGGNLAQAGAQIPNKSTDEVYEELLKAIDDYLKRENNRGGAI